MAEYEGKIAFNQYLAALGPRAPVKTFDEFIARGEFHSSLKASLETDRRVVDGLNDAEYKNRLLRRDDLRKAVMNVMAANKLDAILYPHQRRLVVPIGEDQVDRNGVLSNSTGFPAITFPGGFSRPTVSAPLGVPVGIELLGPELQRADAHRVGVRFRAGGEAPPASCEHATASSLIRRPEIGKRLIPQALPSPDSRSLISDACEVTRGAAPRADPSGRPGARARMRRRRPRGRSLRRWPAAPAGRCSGDTPPCCRSRCRADPDDARSASIASTERKRPDAGANADQPRDAARDAPHHLLTTGAERHADADLARPPADGKRDDGVEADAGQHQTEAGEDAEKRGDRRRRRLRVAPDPAPSSSPSSPAA